MVDNKNSSNIEQPETPLMTQPCTQEGAIDDIKGLMKDLTVEMKDFVKEMKEISLEDREHRVKIEQIEKDNNILFKRVRRLEDEVIPPIIGWKNKMDGGLKVAIFIPSILSGISIIVTIWGKL